MGFLGIGAMEALVIIVAALIIFGPGRLPEVMGQAGRVLRDLRRASEELTGDFRESIDEVRRTYDEVEEDMRKTAQELRRESNQIAKEVNTAVSDIAKSEPARRQRTRPRASQKLDQLDVTPEGDLADSDGGATSAPANKPAAKRATTQKKEPVKPARASTVVDDLLAVDDSEEDLLSLNGALRESKDEPVASD